MGIQHKVAHRNSSNRVKVYQSTRKQIVAEAVATLASSQLRDLPAEKSVCGSTMISISLGEVLFFGSKRIEAMAKRVDSAILSAILETYIAGQKIAVSSSIIVTIFNELLNESDSAEANTAMLECLDFVRECGGWHFSEYEFTLVA